jgi:hypothetical protein
LKPFPPKMPVALVQLFVNNVNTRPATPVADVTTLAKAGQAITYNIGQPYATRWFWVRVVDDAGNEKITDLGSYRTQDNTPPDVTLSLALGNPSVSTIVATFNVTDASGQLSEVWTHITTGAAPTTSAAVRATGVQKTVGTTSHTFTGLTANVVYYVTVLGKDAAGNERMFTQSITTATDNTPPNLESYMIRPPVGAEGNPELLVVIYLTVSDVVAHV